MVSLLPSLALLGWQVSLVLRIQHGLPLWLQHAMAAASVLGSGAASFLLPALVYWWVDPEVRSVCV